MGDKKQQTKPKQGRPATIPVPKKDDFNKVLKRAISGRDSKKSK